MVVYLFSHIKEVRGRLPRAGVTTLWHHQDSRLLSVPSAKLAFILKMEMVQDGCQSSSYFHLGSRIEGREKGSSPYWWGASPQVAQHTLQSLTLIGHLAAPAAKEAQKCISGSRVALLKKMKRGHLVGNWWSPLMWDRHWRQKNLKEKMD